MRRFKGEFKDISNTTVYVTITPFQKTYTEDVEIRFSYDDPVIIACNNDRIFAPIRTKSCTIKIFTDEIYWDLYTPNSTGYEVEVKRNSNILFKGFLTPCVYTQDYLYKSEIELEAIDYLAVLEQFKYKVNGDTEIITIDDLLKRCIYKPIYETLPSNSDWYVNYSDYDFTKFNIQESNFFDDDGEPMTCKEILTELMNYLGLSIQTHENKFYIFDVKSNPNPITLNVENYGAGSPTIELDEVYNKITIGCNLYEVENLTTDFFDKDDETLFNEIKYSTGNYQIYSDYYYSWREHGHHTEDKNKYYLYIKPYQFVDDSIDSESKKGNWSSPTRYIKDLSLFDETAANRATVDTQRYMDSQGNKLFVPQYTGAYPIRVFQYSKAEGIESKKNIDWKDYILFPSVDWDNKDNRFIRDTYPALIYKSTDNLAYSINNGTGYIVIDFNVFCQSDIGFNGVDNDVIWTKAYNNDDYYKEEETVANPIPMDNVGLTFDADIQTFLTRKSTATNYNTGWEFITCKVKVGDKYWNGTHWTNINSTFKLRVHDQDASGDDEKFSYFKWLEIVPNPDIPKYTVGQDGYAIPITRDDGLNGKFEFEIYTPKPIEITSLVKMRTCNNYFLKDLSVKYVYKDSYHWADDKKIEDDIVYENIINEDYAVEMDELDLKINSWYQDKPISKSYMLDENYLPVVKINRKVQEERLLEKYYNHYSIPKKIFILNYKTLDVNPMQTFSHTQTNTNYNIMGFSMNVANNETELKLIEI